LLSWGRGVGGPRAAGLNPFIPARGSPIERAPEAPHTCSANHAELQLPGEETRVPGTTPPSIRGSKSPGNFVIVGINLRYRHRHERSALPVVVEAIVRDMAGKEGLVSPYRSRPCTAMTFTTSTPRGPRRRGCSAAGPRHRAHLRVRASGMLARLVRQESAGLRTGIGMPQSRRVWRGGVDGRVDSFNQWLVGRPGSDGWFHARGILADATDDAQAKASHQGHGATT